MHLALQEEMRALLRARESASAELSSLLAGAESGRATRAREEEHLREPLSLLNKRLRAADQAALAAEQRLAELDDLEFRLRQEFEAEERDLLRQRQELEELERRLRSRPLIPATSRALDSNAHPIPLRSFVPGGGTWNGS